MLSFILTNKDLDENYIPNICMHSLSPRQVLVIRLAHAILLLFTILSIAGDLYKSRKFLVV